MKKVLTVNESFIGDLSVDLLNVKHHRRDMRGWITMDSDAFTNRFGLPRKNIENIEILCHEFVEASIFEWFDREMGTYSYYMDPQHPVGHVIASLCHGTYVIGFKFYGPDKILRYYLKLWGKKRSVVLAL